MNSSLEGRCRWKTTEYEFWHLLTWLQETSKKAVLSQIEQADKFQEVSSPLIYPLIVPMWFSLGGDCWVGAEGHWIDLNFSKIRTRANQYGKTSVKLSSSNCRQRESFNVIKGILVGNLYVIAFLHMYNVYILWCIRNPYFLGTLLHLIGFLTVFTEAKICHSWTAVKSLSSVDPCVLNLLMPVCRNSKVVNVFVQRFYPWNE